MTGRPDPENRHAVAMAGIGQLIVLAAILLPKPLLAQGQEPSVSGPEAQITEYLGGGYMTLSDECADHGWSGTQQVLVRMQPQGMLGNDENETQMAFFFPTGVISFRFDHTQETMNDGAPITQATYVWNGPYSPAEPTMTIAYRSRYGDYIPNGGAQLHSVFLTIGNFNEHRGCSATMRVSLGRN